MRQIKRKYLYIARCYLYHLFVTILHITVVQYEKKGNTQTQEVQQNYYMIEIQYNLNMNVTLRHCHVHNKLSRYKCINGSKNPNLHRLISAAIICLEIAKTHKDFFRYDHRSPEDNDDILISSLISPLVPHICVSESISIGLDNGLSPNRRQAII